jgi:hypothetical protein
MLDGELSDADEACWSSLTRLQHLAYLTLSYPMMGSLATSMVGTAARLRCVFDNARRQTDRRQPGSAFNFFLLIPMVTKVPFIYRRADKPSQCAGAKMCISRARAIAVLAWIGVARHVWMWKSRFIQAQITWVRDSCFRQASVFSIWKACTLASGRPSAWQVAFSFSFFYYVIKRMLNYLQSKAISVRVERGSMCEGGTWQHAYAHANAVEVTIDWWETNPFTTIARIRL